MLTILLNCSITFTWRNKKRVGGSGGGGINLIHCNREIIEEGLGEAIN